MQTYISKYQNIIIILT